MESINAMRRFAPVLAATSFFLLTGFVLQDVKIAQVPAPLAGATLALSSDRPALQDVDKRAFAMPDRSLFLTQKAGGNLLVGLFVPFGALANGANVDRRTQTMGQDAASSSLGSIDALAEAHEAWKDAPTPTTDAAVRPPEVQLQPFVLYNVASNNTGIQTVVSIRATSTAPIEGTRNGHWVGQYGFVLARDLPREDLDHPMSADTLDAYRAAIRAGYQELFSEIRKDLATQPPPVRQIAWIKSPVVYFGLGFPGDIDRDASGRLVLHANARNSGVLVHLPFDYEVFVFPSGEQYSIEQGPVDRKNSP